MSHNTRSRKFKKSVSFVDDLLQLQGDPGLFRSRSRSCAPAIEQRAAEIVADAVAPRHRPGRCLRASASRAPGRPSASQPSSASSASRHPFTPQQPPAPRTQWAVPK